MRTDWGSVVNRRRWAFVSLLAGSILAPAPRAPAASFDCAKAATTTEQLICGDPQLSQLDGQLAQAYRRALEADPVSAFGGVIGVNRTVDAAAADEMSKLFLEVVTAPAFHEAAKARFASKKNLRLVEVADLREKWVFKNVSGGVLLQDADVRPLTESDLRVVSKRQPTPEEKRALLFAWKVCKHVKSNAIVYARDGQTVGVGAGQMSRVDSCKIGAMKAVLPLQGTVAASDAFFPFPDGVEEIGRVGAVFHCQFKGTNVFTLLFHRLDS